MPREGTKTPISFLYTRIISIEIRYAPGGDENLYLGDKKTLFAIIEIRYAPGGDENIILASISEIFNAILIKNAPAGHEKNQ